MPNVTIYTDGSCLKNPGGNGGWAAVIKRDGEETRMCGGVARTTNNRMEITALLEALRSLDEPSTVLVITDSQYVSNSVNKGWLAGWARKGWVDKEGNARLNADLWKLLLEELGRHRVTIRWIRGHAGHRENELCDRLARKAAEGPNLPRDEGYAAMLAEVPRNGSASRSKSSWKPTWKPDRTPDRTPKPTSRQTSRQTSSRTPDRKPAWKPDWTPTSKSRSQAPSQASRTSPVTSPVTSPMASSGKAFSDPDSTATGTKTAPPAATSRSTTTARKDTRPKDAQVRDTRPGDAQQPRAPESRGEKDAATRPAAPAGPRKRSAGTRLVPGTLDALLRPSKD